MTLILTAISRQSVVQLADMRLTEVGTGRVRDDATAKMVGYGGRFVFSFTGPAWMGRQPTTQWIASVLSNGGDPRDVLATVASKAQPIVSRYPLSHRRLAIVGAGWLGPATSPRPIYARIANFDAGSGALLPRFVLTKEELQAHEKLRLFTAGVLVPEPILQDAERVMRRRAGRRVERPEEFVSSMLLAGRLIAYAQPTVGRKVLVSSIPGVRRAGGPAVLEPGVHVPPGRPDWRGPVYAYVADGRGEAQSITPAYAQPGVASPGAWLSFGLGDESLGTSRSRD